jgi:hypothetical protein
LIPKYSAIAHRQEKGVQDEEVNGPVSVFLMFQRDQASTMINTI